MLKPKNIQIPLDVFNDIVDLLYCLADCSCFHNPNLAALHLKVDSAIRQKRVSLLLRESYADIIHVDDEAAKDAARVNYLNTKKIYNRFS